MPSFVVFPVKSSFYRCFLLAIALASLSACSRFTSHQDVSANLVLETSLKQEQVQPGAPVLVKVVLTNKGSESLRVQPLDQSSMRFAFWPKGEEAQSNSTRFIEPVYSELEKVGSPVKLEQGKNIERTFLFTRLSFERGPFVFSTSYLPERTGAQPRVYSRSVPFTVSGQNVYVHRLVDGLISRTDAIELAAKAAGMPGASGDAIMIVDNAGFKKWWVNIGGMPTTAPAKTSAAAALPTGAIKSYYIDPYLGVVFGEAAAPFTPEMKVKGIKPVPKDSKALQAVRKSRVR